MLTESQRKERMKFWGSSDSARSLAMGQLAACVASKIYQTETEPTEAMALGNALEGPLLDWWQDRHQLPLDRDVQVTQTDSDMGADLDGWNREEGIIVEAKWVGHNAHLWGEPNTDEVPEYVLIQVHHQMAVIDCGIAHIIAWFHDRGRQQFIVERQPDLCEGLIEYAKAIWTEYVVPGVIPDYDVEQAPAVLEALAKRRRDTGLAVTVDPLLVQHWEQARAAKLWAERIEGLCKARLIEALGEGDQADLPDGRILTYTEHSRRAYQVKASTVRTLRIKKGLGDGSNRASLPESRCIRGDGL